MEAGQQIEHLDGFFQQLLNPMYAGPALGQIVFDSAALAAIDTTHIRPLAAEFAARGLWNGPTLALFETVANDSTADDLLARANMQFIVPTAATAWANQRRQQQANAPPLGVRQRFIDLRRQIVRALDAQGAKLLVGSDSPQAFMTPGDAVHRELEAFVAAGLTPYRALLAATRNPAEYLGHRSGGTVAVGRPADLVMIDGNPLVQIGNTRRVVGTMVGGRWYDSTAIAGIKAAVIARLKQ
jgi:predicted amidohydrolase YtcJ